LITLSDNLRSNEQILYTQTFLIKEVKIIEKREEDIYIQSRDVGYLSILN